MCVPEILNVFDDLNVPICNSSQGDINLLALFGTDSLIPEFKCDCLDPCYQQKYKYKVSKYHVYICTTLSFQRLKVLKTKRTLLYLE